MTMISKRENLVDQIVKAYERAAFGAAAMDNLVDLTIHNDLSTNEKERLTLAIRGAKQSFESIWKMLVDVESKLPIELYG